MKHCENCNKDYDTEENVCPVCGSELLKTEENSEDETDELVAAMTITGIL